MPTNNAQLDLVVQSAVNVDADVAVADDQTFTVGCTAPTITNALNQLQGSRWAPTDRLWRIPATGPNAKALYDLCMAHGLTVREDAHERLDELRTLSALSRALDGPILDIQLGETPRPFQWAAVEYVRRARRVVIGDDRGIGKTAEALIAVEALGAYPCLIVVQPGVVVKWLRDAELWLPHRSASAAKDDDITVVSYDELRNDETLTRMSWQTIICDEAHVLRTAKAQMTQAVHRIARRASVAMLLTGTPLANRPRDLISLLTILGRLEAFGGWDGYTKRYCGRKKTRLGHWDISGASRLEELHERLRDTCYIRRLKKDALPELLGKTRHIVSVTLGDREAYDRATHDAIRPMAHDGRGGEGALEWARRWRRAEALVRQTRLRAITTAAKLPAAVDWIRTQLTDRPEAKIAVFAESVAAQKHILAAFPQAAALLGGTRPRKRQEIIDEFTADPDCRLIVCALRAAGVGIELQAAKLALIVDLPWVPLDLDQAEDRLARWGQLWMVEVTYLIAAGTIDEDMVARLNIKADVSGRVSDGIDYESVELIPTGNRVTVSVGGN